ncbi:hypothetical protein ATCC90586_002566 [Pythium insidiosum]|nr:hypothetical protein ATCC90586_002566 [Pythium insidiosum]
MADILALVHAVLVTQLEKKLAEASLLANYAKVVAARRRHVLLLLLLLELALLLELVLEPKCCATPPRGDHMRPPDTGRDAALGDGGASVVTERSCCEKAAPVGPASAEIPSVFVSR